MKPNSSSILGPLFTGGLVAGIVDIGAASAINAVRPVVILHAVASGLLGRDAFRGGTATAWLGLGLQCAMSVIIAAIFVVASRRLPVLRRRWVAAGLGYGAVVFAVMNYGVMPLSAIAHSPHFTAASFIENFLAMLLFGSIVSYFAR